MAGDRGIFERFGVLSVRKGIGYVLRLFPFCSGLGAELVAARGAGSEAGRLGDPVPRGPEEAKPKVSVELGWTGRRCRALIRAQVRGAFDCTAKPRGAAL